MSDESDPETGTCPLCPDTHFQCGTGRCIDKAAACDGRKDCGDWSDESEEACLCSDDEIRCANPPGQTVPPGACIPPEWICDEDGIEDCPGDEDEANCTHVVGFNASKKVREFPIRA